MCLSDCSHYWMEDAVNRDDNSPAADQSEDAFTRLLAIAQSMVDNSTAPEAKGFDTANWLWEWLKRTNPALGCKPIDLVSTPTGLDQVARVLGAMESGAYQ